MDKFSCYYLEISVFVSVSSFVIDLFILGIAEYFLNISEHIIFTTRQLCTLDLRNEALNDCIKEFSFFDSLCFFLSGYQALLLGDLHLAQSPVFSTFLVANGCHLVLNLSDEPQGVLFVF